MKKGNKKQGSIILFPLPPSAQGRGFKKKRQKRKEGKMGEKEEKQSEKGGKGRKA